MVSRTWPDTYCSKTKGFEHEVYYTDHGGRDVCRCGATRMSVARANKEHATAARDEAMQAVDETTSETWKVYADEFIHNYSKHHLYVHVDDLWEAGLEKPPSPRALGPRMLAASRAGWIRKTDRVRPSVRSHMTGKPVWISQVYDEGSPG